MKVAFVANTCWNIYNFRKGLVYYFISKGDEVFVLAPYDEYTERIRSWGVTIIDTPLDGTGANPLKDFRYFNKLRITFKKRKPDVILSYTIKSNIYSCLAALSMRSKVICNVSGLGTVFLTKGVAGSLAQHLYKIAFRFSSHIFFQNQDDVNLFTSKIKVDKNKTSVLPGSGIDLEAFKPLELPNDSNTRFLMIARLIIEKGVREFAEAASSFKDDKKVTFTLVGKFDETHSRSISKSELDYWVENGWLDYKIHSDEISKLIADHDVIVLPSYREGTPRTLLEGAAHGRPLLASNVPGCREVVIEGVNGFLFDVSNVESIVNKIKLYLSLRSDEKKLLAENSRTLVEEKFDEKRVVDAYDQVIHRILHGR